MTYSDSQMSDDTKIGASDHPPANVVAHYEMLADLIASGQYVFVAIDKTKADRVMRHWSRPVQFRLDKDKHDPRLRRLVVRPTGNPTGA